MSLIWGEISVDFILPVLLWDCKLCEEAVTGILVQIRRCQAKGTMVKSKIDKKTINFFPIVPSADSTTNNHPYISLVMELGMQNKPSPTAVMGTNAESKEAKPPVHTNNTPQVDTMPLKLMVQQPG